MSANQDYIKNTQWSLFGFLTTGRVYAAPMEMLLHPWLFRGVERTAERLEFATEWNAAAVCRNLGLPDEWEAGDENTWPVAWRYENGLEFGFTDSEEGNTRYVKFKLWMPAQMRNLSGEYKHYVVATNGWDYDTAPCDVLELLQAEGISSRVIYRIEEDRIEDFRIKVDGGATMLFKSTDLEESLENKEQTLVETMKYADSDGIYIWADGHEPDWQPGEELSAQEYLELCKKYGISGSHNKNRTSVAWW